MIVIKYLCYYLFLLYRKLLDTKLLINYQFSIFKQQLSESFKKYEITFTTKLKKNN